MMKQIKILILCAILLTSTFVFAACGRSNNTKDNINNNNTQAPYEDEVNNPANNGVNNMENGVDPDMNNDLDMNPEDTMNNGAVQDDLENGASNLEDAGKNLVDSIEDAGDAIIDGVDEISNPDNNNTNNR